ncbi:MAG: methylated-DNA--[protein]-cysteine S-methyltransferase [Chloroflexia bacterium]
MNENGSRSLAEARAMVGALRELGAVEAPTTLLAGVLGELGAIDLAFSVESPIGTVYVAYNGRGISMLSPAADAEEFAGAFQRRFGRAVRATDAPSESVARAVRRKLRGERATVEYDLRGLSDFERATLLKAAEIPRGEVRPYAWIAREIGKPGAVRAVGSALGRNPVPLLIPCHRVILSDGTPGNYALGREAKATVLAAEGLEATELVALSKAGIRFTGSDTTRIYCYPTCHNARRTTPDHTVNFGSMAAAKAAGYRACKVCRPEAG